jgi:hypothetical protein
MIAEFDINLTGNAPAQPVPVPPPAAGGE